MRLALAAAAALGLAACSNGMDHGSRISASPAMTGSNFSANPPDRQTGSAAYQSPDLERTQGGTAPQGSGAAQYQRR
jgi:hypothetical protein